MAKILDNRNTPDQTIRIFDSFYAFEAVVNGSEYDIVFGYFKNICATKQIAENFSAALFRIAQESGISVMDLLAAIKGKNNLQMNQIISYYLNSFKSKTALYGVATIPRPNQFVSRNIIDSAPTS